MLNIDRYLFVLFLRIYFDSCWLKTMPCLKSLYCSLAVVMHHVQPTGVPVASKLKYATPLLVGGAAGIAYLTIKKPSLSAFTVALAEQTKFQNSVSRKLFN